MAFYKPFYMKNTQQCAWALSRWLSNIAFDDVMEGVTSGKKSFIGLRTEEKEDAGIIVCVNDEARALAYDTIHKGLIAKKAPTLAELVAKTKMEMNLD